jgi:ribokinase
VPRVLVVGSANVDFTVAVPRLPRAGETVSDGTLLVNHGGKGANQAVAARRLGADVRLIGCVGHDASGREIIAALGAEGIGTAGLAASLEAATGTALIIVDGDGRNQIAVAPGANRALTAAHVRERADDFAWAEVVVVSCEVPPASVRAALALARERGAITILNPAPVPEAGLDCLDLVDYLTPNAGEAARLSGVSGEDVAAAARAGAVLRARGARCVVVTRGEHGVLACGDQPAWSVPAPAVAAVDTTAAGDAFSGALAVGLIERGRLADALRFANAAAALACTRRGAQASLPTRAEVDRAAG